MRLAGTINMYSKKAMPQLAMIVANNVPGRPFRWPYQA
jgi:hypothetical protein